MAPESNDLGSQPFVCLFSLCRLLIFFFREDVQPSPSKKYKKSAPGSPEYESQPAVVITYVIGCSLQTLLTF